MVVIRIPAGAVIRSTILIGLSIPLFAQQSNHQLSLLPRSVANLEATSDSDTESYISSVTKRPAPFHPNSLGL